MAILKRRKNWLTHAFLKHRPLSVLYLRIGQETKDHGGWYTDQGKRQDIKWKQNDSFCQISISHRVVNLDPTKQNKDWVYK